MFRSKLVTFLTVALPWRIKRLIACLAYDWKSDSEYFRGYRHEE